MNSTLRTPLNPNRAGQLSLNVTLIPPRIDAAKLYKWAAIVVSAVMKMTLSADNSNVSPTSRLKPR